MFVTISHVLSIAEFECFSDVRVWDGGVAQKMLENLWFSEVLLAQL